MAQSKSSAGGGSASCSTEQTGMIATPNPGGIRPSEPDLWALACKKFSSEAEFLGGHDAGEALAGLFLHHMVRNPSQAPMVHIFLALARKYANANTSKARSAAHGQIVGFAQVIEEWAGFAARHATGRPLSVPVPELVEKLRAGLRGDPDIECASEDAPRRAARAKMAANARWAKHRAAKQENSHV